MSYLLFFFVLLASLLTYMFFPRNDRFKIEMTQEDTSIVSFLNQHQAARNYMYQMASWRDTGNKPHIFEYNNLVRMMPHVTQGSAGSGLDINDISEEYYGADKAKPQDGSFGSAIVCLDNHGNLAGCPANKHYVMTYGYVPSWWSSETERRQVWIKAMLKRSHGSAHCGTFEYVPPPDGSSYSIFNGQKYTGFESKVIGSKKYRIIPQKIGEWLDNNMNDKTAGGDRIALLLCMSQVIPPYEEEPIFNVDSINNTGNGYLKPVSSPARPLVPIAGTLDGSKITGIPSTKNYTIVGVVDIPQYECLHQGCSPWSGSMDLIKNEGTTPFSISTNCSGDVCSLRAGTNTATNLVINDIPKKRPYVFYYTASTTGQSLNVYFPITTTETVSIEGGETVTTHRKGWEEREPITPTCTAPGIELKSATSTEAFHIDTHWYKSPLMALRIYNGTLNPYQIRHNLNADRKRFGLHSKEAAPTE